MTTKSQSRAAATNAPGGFTHKAEIEIKYKVGQGKGKKPVVHTAMVLGVSGGRYRLTDGQTEFWKSRAQCFDRRIVFVEL